MPEPWFASTLDGLTPISVSIPSSAANVNTVTTQRGVFFTTTAGVGARSPLLPVRNSGSAGLAYNRGGNTNFRTLITYTAADGSNRFRVVDNVGATSEFQYWDGSSWVRIGDTFSFTIAAVFQVRFEWSGYGTNSGAISIRIFADAGEAPLATRSISGLDFTGVSGIARVEVLQIATGGGTAGSVAAFFIADDNGDASYVYQDVANADGSDTNGTGTFASVNTTGANYDASFISLPNSGNRRSVKNTANRNYGNRTVRAVAVNARLRRGATGVSQARVYLTIGGIRYYHPSTPLTLTTSFESYTFVWESDPSTGAGWTLTGAQAASLEWGVEAV